MTAPLPARAAYPLWAGTYDSENAVTWLEQKAVTALTPPLAGRWLLDAACGIGRRMPRAGGAGPERVFGVDLVWEMLTAGAHVSADLSVAVADVQALPCRDRIFHVVWCRLAIGHLSDPLPLYRELARVARPGAHIIVTDFHPAAASAGHTRTFRDQSGGLNTIQHFIHDMAAHERAAKDTGLSLKQRLEPAAGPEVRPFYEAAGKLDAYEQHRELPLVLALLFRT